MILYVILMTLGIASALLFKSAYSPTLVIVGTLFGVAGIVAAGYNRRNNISHSWVECKAVNCQHNLD
jgi:hypothetical protein